MTFLEEEEALMARAWEFLGVVAIEGAFEDFFAFYHLSTDSLINRGVDLANTIRRCLALPFAISTRFWFGHCRWGTSICAGLYP